MTVPRQEPISGTPSIGVQNLRKFVLLRHELDEDQPARSHWDLMIESGSMLWTWRLERLPHDNDQVLAEAIADHRPVYLEFEGTLSDRRGHIQRIDAGEFRPSQWSDRRIVGRIHGNVLHGDLYLSRRGLLSSWSLEIKTNRLSESVSNS